MARPTILKICFVIAALSCLGVSGSYAAESKSITGSILIGGGTYSPSNKVTVNVSVGPTGCIPSSTNTCQEYAAKSKHASGDRVIATNNTDPKVYYKTVVQTLPLETLTGGSTESFTVVTDWTAM